MGKLRQRATPSHSKLRQSPPLRTGLTGVAVSGLPLRCCGLVEQSQSTHLGHGYAEAAMPQPHGLALTWLLHIQISLHCRGLPPGVLPPSLLQGEHSCQPGAWRPSSLSGLPTHTPSLHPHWVWFTSQSSPLSKDIQLGPALTDPQRFPGEAPLATVSRCSPPL